MMWFLGVRCDSRGRSRAPSAIAQTLLDDRRPAHHPDRMTART
jgi:hypothetical protein